MSTFDQWPGATQQNEMDRQEIQSRGDDRGQLPLNETIMGPIDVVIITYELPTYDKCFVTDYDFSAEW